MATATVSTDDLTMVFEATFERNDYGVPGSPVWYEPVDIKLVALEVLGCEVDVKFIPDDLYNTLVQDFGHDGLDWEDE